MTCDVFCSQRTEASNPRVWSNGPSDWQVLLIATTRASPQIAKLRRGTFLGVEVECMSI